MKKQWIKFGIVTTLYLLFLIWLQSWLGLILLPLIYDAYITKKIHWDWWKDRENPTRMIMSWVDALIFALVAVYFINLFFFQNYVIPSSSLEKSLLTGDYLFVSKMSYGPRIPQTPLTMPLTQHTMPLLGCKSYIEWPQWEYRRAPGFGNVELNDIVVFNYPAGDSILSEERFQTMYYEYCYREGAKRYLETKCGVAINTREQEEQLYSIFKQAANLDSISPLQQRAVFNDVYNMGRAFLSQNITQYGKIDSRPVDRRENYVKRCVGLPGQTLQIKDHIIYLDGKANKEPDNVQYNYQVEFIGELPEDLIEELQISKEDRSRTMLLEQGHYLSIMPLTQHAYEVLKSRTDLVKSISLCKDLAPTFLFPLNGNYGWTVDNYGPLWIPKKDTQIPGGLTLQNLPIYERCIKVYEGNDLQVTADGKILINGKEANNYTFKLDYYWMQGDNRHNSADSRFWGFVPEDHVVGKPLFIWLSVDPDKSFFSGIRWSRIFSWVDNIK